MRATARDRPAATSACSTYLLDAVLVAFLESQDLIGSLLGVVDLLPCLLLFLLEEGNTIGQQLRVPLDTV